jgi:polysaccharide export outer membrane protein
MTCRTLSAATATLLLASSTAVAAPQARLGESGAPSTTLATSRQFVIAPEDEIGILFWKETDISGSVVVRPDGMVTIPLLGDVRAAGLTPAALAADLEVRAARYLTGPKVTVSVRQMNSRKVYVTGEVNAPGAYPLTGSRTVIQAIALAGGLREYARAEAITLLRQDGDHTLSFRFNYEDVSRGRNLDQNVELMPGDTIVVP